MWTSTRFTERFGCRYPMVQGPMGGGASTPELVAAVSNADGLGSLGCYHLEPAAILGAAADIRRLTSEPFNLNLWIPREREDGGSLGAPEAARALARLQPYRDELGLPPLAEPPTPTVQDFERQFEAVLEARPAVFSFIFGLLPAPLVAEARRRGIALIGTATTVEEAEALEESGVDLVVALAGPWRSFRVRVWLSTPWSSLSCVVPRLGLNLFLLFFPPGPRPIFNQ